MALTKPLQLNRLAKTISAWAEEKGFWERPAAAGPAAEWIVQHQKSTKIALMHEELSELLNAVRTKTEDGKALPSTKIPGFTNEEEEIADLVIRALDYAGQYQLDIAGALAAKMEHNLSRPHKHGRNF